MTRPRASIGAMSWWLWVLSGIGLLVVEMVTPGGFFALFFGIGALCTALVAALGAGATVQWLLFTAISLVLLATKRTRQLMAGARPRIPTSKNKPNVLSLREIATGKVRFDRSVRDALAGKFDSEKVTVSAGQTRTLR